MSEIILMSLGVLCACYGIFIFAGHSGTWFFAVWLLLAVFFAGWVLLLHSGALQKLPAVLRNIFRIMICAGVFVLIFTCAQILSGFHEKGRDGLDYIIVLGAQVREDGPSRVLKYRLDRAAEYLRDNPGTLCIVSGGQGYNEPTSEASAMQEYLVSAGIAPGRILLEDQSKDTNQNIRFSLRLLPSPDTSVGIVTNNFHVYRATRIARKCGLTNVCGIAAGSTASYLPNNVLREVCGVIKDRMAGNM